MDSEKWRLITVQAASPAWAAGGEGVLGGSEAIFSLSYQRLAARIPKHESLVVTSRDLLWELYISLRRDGRARFYPTGFS